MSKQISPLKRLRRKSLKLKFRNGIIFLVLRHVTELIVVVGQVEQDGHSVNVRIRDDVSTRNQGVPIALDEIIAKLVELRDARSLKHSLE